MARRGNCGMNIYVTDSDEIDEASFARPIEVQIFGPEAQILFNYIFL